MAGKNGIGRNQKNLWEDQKSNRKARVGLRQLTFAFVLSCGIKSTLRLVTRHKTRLLPVFHVP